MEEAKETGDLGAIVLKQRGRGSCRGTVPGLEGTEVPSPLSKLTLIFKITFSLILCVSMHMYVCLLQHAHMWRSENSLWELILSTM